MLGYQPAMYRPSAFDVNAARTLGGDILVEQPLMHGKAGCVTCGAPVDPDGGYACPEQQMYACSLDCAQIEDDAYNTHFNWRPLRGGMAALSNEPMPEGGGIKIGGLWVLAGLALVGYAFLVRPSKRGR